MKLYTEDQIWGAMRESTFAFNTDESLGKIIESLTPIELPTNEEIYNASLSISFDRVEFMEGAKWVREHIKKQINQQP